MLNEDLLCYLWTYQYFDKKNLCTTSGLPIQILHPGIRNYNQGPDFSQARILIDDLEWHGNVEIHVKSGEWNQHHAGDVRYDTTVLHVVWQNNLEIFRTDGSYLPALELKPIVSPLILEQCAELLFNKEDPACRGHWINLPSIYVSQMFERCAAEKLEFKSVALLKEKADKNLSWEELLWNSIALAIVRKINRPSMEFLLQQLDYKTLYRYRTNIKWLEALLLGQSGLLPKDNNSSYAGFLNTEYNYLKELLQLPEPMNRSQWNFLRTRPGNFPQVRLIQLCRFMQRLDDIKTCMLNMGNTKELSALFRTRMMNGDKDAYHFLGIQDYHTEPGQETIQSLIINSLAPWMVAYSRYNGSPVFADKALEWLEELPAENNKITRLFKTPQFEIQTAMETQGAIWLYEHYCQPKKCLHCRIGCKILNGVAEHSI